MDRTEKNYQSKRYEVRGHNNRYMIFIFSHISSHLFYIPLNHYYYYFYYYFILVIKVIIKIKLVYISNKKLVM